MTITNLEPVVMVAEAKDVELVPLGEELLNIRTDEETGETIISGRELHESLKVSTQYTKWFERMSEYGFVENIDYVLVSQKCPTNNPKNPYTIRTDHLLKLDMAKEIAMIQRTPEGKRIRQYLIQVEKAWNSPEKIMERALLIAKNNINRLEIENKAMKPKAIFADAVASSEQSILVGELAKLLKQNGINTGQKRLFEYLRENGYLIKRKGSDYNMPTQRSMELGIMEIKETVINNPDGTVRINKTPKITGKGQTYFVNKFLNPKEI
ncbi:phage antirepressor KilAC domain-containing protein [Peptacetobacter sp.]|uniref:phage antirepressor KilAC domain-containing protein n=1 Tax=Peptacetobacter sp. TaxID=2991975 RepID=UPI002E77FB13|nr:phage antirepressor KilAC domain-containing protein [Peptacetobacter sp.]MEE0451948.1 phage antirepressor KilAC domain-containing protein [Peptacetobacter sp.]